MRTVRSRASGMNSASDTAPMPMPRAAASRIASRLPISIASFGPHARARERLVERAPRAGAAFALEHRLAVQFLQPDLAAVGKGMVAVHEQDQRMPRIRRGAEARRLVEARQHADVDGVVLEVLEHRRRVAHADRHVEPRIALAVGVDHLDHVEGADRAQLELARLQVAAVVQQVVRSSSSEAICRAMGSSRSPTLVSSMRCPWRWNSTTLCWRSSACTCVVSVGWLRPTARAAALKLPCWATARKARSLAADIHRLCEWFDDKSVIDLI
jgi:hypothetical protein